jgi:hypothetical protein
LPLQSEMLLTWHKATEKLLAKPQQRLTEKSESNGEAVKIPSSFLMASNGMPNPSETAERILRNEGTVFCSQLELPIELLKRMVAAAENDRPISIVRQDTRKQIIVNQPMADMLQTSPEIATQRVMTRFWLPEDLAELEQRLTMDRQFTWTYSAGLNEQAWAVLTTQFEAFEADGIWYRQGICLSTPQLVPIPSRAFAPA